MKAKKFTGKRILAAALAFSITAAASVCPIFAADDVDSLKAKQDSLAQQQQQNSSQLASLRQNEAEKSTYASTLKAQLATIEEQVNNYNNQITDLDLQAQKAETEIAATEKQIKADTTKLKERLCALYKSGGAGNLQILLSSKDLADLADKSEAVSMVTAHDTDLINRLKSEKQAVQAKEVSIKQQRQQVESIKADVSAKQQQLTDTLSETNQFLQNIGQQEINLQSQGSTLEAQAAKISTAIDSWSQSQKPQSSQTSNSDSGSGSSTEDSSQSSSSSDNSSNSSSSSNESPSSFSSVIGKAESALGKPYVMGAAGPDAFDCSGLVCWAFGIGRATAQGLYNECSKVSVSERQPGDLIFFSGTYDCGETVTHVGIYIGSNTMIDAEDGGVSECSTESSYNLQHFYAYGRL